MAERAFWRKVAVGLTSEDAAVVCGVSGPVGTRWFRERGGMSLDEELCRPLKVGNGDPDMVDTADTHAFSLPAASFGPSRRRSVEPEAETAHSQ